MENRKIEYGEIVLEKKKIAMCKHMNKQVLNDLTARWSEGDTEAFIHNYVVLLLESDLMRHKAGEKVVQVPVEVTVKTQRGPLTWAAAVATVFAYGSMVFGLGFDMYPQAFLTALVAFMVLGYGVMNVPHTTTVTKMVEVKNDYWNAFPENTIQFPEALGRVVYQTETTARVVKEEDDSGT